MKKAVIYIHGKNGSAAEAEHYEPLFPGRDMLGFEYKAETPWEAKREFGTFFDGIFREYDAVYLIANSIGAFFVMNADIGSRIGKAFMISPIVDMERLIGDMMGWAGVTEEELRQRGEIPTAFGETLSWEYLCYVREHPIEWKVPTAILRGEWDNLTSRETMEAFAARHGAALEEMPGGEHWFHTEEQMKYLDEWIGRNKNDE